MGWKSQTNQNLSQACGSLKKSIIEGCSDQIES